jgi:hypothetical protein
MMGWQGLHAPILVPLEVVHNTVTFIPILATDLLSIVTLFCFSGVFNSSTGQMQSGFAVMVQICI